ncbi:MAG TPA: DEAD/DEAH box helicase [Gemmatimonadales bacterium]|nr:DEAD/DEAH box helicase [Gemmatimonadales bacterium]
MPPTAGLWTEPSRVLSEHLAPLAEPLTCLLAPGAVDSPQAVARLAARALLDVLAEDRRSWPGWLAPHQVPAAARLVGILMRHRGGLLADAVGLGKSYVALAVALALGGRFALVVPAVLVPQWRALLQEREIDAPVFTHEWLSGSTVRPSDYHTVGLFIVDEAHRFRNPQTKRYGALARMVVGARVLLVTATPVHNRVGDLCHLFRLFLRDHALSALGVPSLSRAARGDTDLRSLKAATARLCVARSRERARSGYDPGAVSLRFPGRTPVQTIRVGPTEETVLESLVSGVMGLEGGGDAAALFRLILLSQLGSSIPAFRASLGRYEALLELSAAAATEGRALGRRAFGRLFAAAQDELQLAFLPLLLPPGASAASERDRALVRRLRQLSTSTLDPKAAALGRILEDSAVKTIVFVRARATVHHLLRRLRGQRIAAVTGEHGWFGAERAPREEVLRAFAPRAQGASDPAAALETHVLVTTDLLSEGLNLQDAGRVIHYDLPWTPARLEQRVGRVDRAQSAHERIEVVAFLPPPRLADAIAIERRLAAKRLAQHTAGGGRAAFDWCDRLYRLATAGFAEPRAGSCAAAAGARDRAVVLVLRIGALVDAVVVTDLGARADPERATTLLERAAQSQPVAVDREALERALRRAAPLLRSRLAVVEDARWRAADRDRLSRRLIPWVLAAARRAARRRQHTELARLDALVSRLALGMTAGEERLLDDLLVRGAPLAIRDVLAWHERLPPLDDAAAAPRVELMAAIVLGEAVTRDAVTAPHSRAHAESVASPRR